jgi:AraC-like DNA-binding protein
MFEVNQNNVLIALQIVSFNDDNHNDLDLPKHYNYIISTFTGAIKINIENIDNVFQPQHLLIIPNHVNFRLTKITAHKIFIVAFSNLIFDDDSFLLLIKTHQLITKHHLIVCEIQDSEMKFIKQYFKLFKSAELNKKLQKEIFLAGLNFLKQKIALKLTSYKSYSTLKFNIFFQFIQLLELNYTQYHSSNFYAKQLKISVNYLNQILKHFTHNTSKKYIEKYIITESKNLLLNSTLSISEISHNLGFQNLSNFSTLFQKHIHCSPSAFRSQKN